MYRFTQAVKGLALILAIFGCGQSSAAPGLPFSDVPHFLPVSKAFAVKTTLAGRKLRIHWTVAKGYYLYRNRISVSSSDGSVRPGHLVFSTKGTIETDPYFGQVTVFDHSFMATSPLYFSGHNHHANLVLTYQGCAKGGLCYPPQTRALTLTVPPGQGLPDRPRRATTKLAAPAKAKVGELTQTLQSAPLWRLTVLFLVLGLGLAFTPCVLPMLPIVASLIGSQREGGSWRAGGLAIFYVLGMAITYSAAGVVTGLFGARFNIQSALQSPWALGGAAALFSLLALACFDVYQLQLPSAFRQKLSDRSQRLNAGRGVGLFGIGALSALIMSPCITPPLAATLLYIGATQDALAGGVVLFALAFGMGLPLMAIAVVGHRMLPRSGSWLKTVKALYGVMLLGVAVWLLSRILPDAVILMILGVAAAVTATQLGAFEAANTGWPRLRKGAGLVLFIYGGSAVIGALSGATSFTHPLSGLFAEAAGKTDPAPSLFQRYQLPQQLARALRNSAARHEPVVLDFYARWCVSCQKMEHQVFTNLGVRHALKHFRRLQIDLTDNSAEEQQLLNRFHLFGPPAVLFFDGKGQELRQDRITGAIGVSAFLNHIHQVQSALIEPQQGLGSRRVAWASH